MSVETCPTCKQGKLVNVKKEEDAEVREFSCGHRIFAITREVAIKADNELKLKLKGPEGKRKRTREIVSRVARGFERRMVRERGATKEETSVIMIDWKKGEISHIHCKRCGNEWRDDEEDITKKFDVKPNATGTFHIRCNKCGRKAMSG